MKKFEYRVERLNIFQEEKNINKLGLQGWEAIGIADANAFQIVLLKRELKCKDNAKNVKPK